MIQKYFINFSRSIISEIDEENNTKTNLFFLDYVDELYLTGRNYIALIVEHFIKKLVKYKIVEPFLLSFKTDNNFFYFTKAIIKFAINSDE
jgi:hypothetical protein